jgi:hypothetical protein
MTVQFVYTILSKAAFIYLLNDYLKRYYPSQYNETVLIVSFNAIYFYSKASELFYKNYYSSSHAREIQSFFSFKEQEINWCIY